MEEKNVASSLLDETTPWSASATSPGLFNLDQRLIKSLQKLDFKYPTLIQAKAVPLALQGKDLFIKAKTGSGKTIAYMLPLLQKVIFQANNQSDSKEINLIQSIVLLPSNELAKQTEQVFKFLLKYCTDLVSLINVNNAFNEDSNSSTEIKKIGNDFMENVQTARSNKKAVILVATPGKLLKLFDFLANSNYKSEIMGALDGLIGGCFVLDEADLLLEYEYKGDIEQICRKYIPKTTQGFIISATLFTKKTAEDSEKSKEREGINFLKTLILHNPVVLSLNDSDDKSPVDNGSITNLNQYYIVVKDAEEKDLLLYVLLKLKLISGKILFFVGTTDESYRLQLLLEQFCITNCIVLNRLLPVMNRLSKIGVFNKGLVDIVIAADSLTNPEALESLDKEKRTEDDYSISRGLDFKEVNFVVNVEMPKSLEEYVHRVGRTARAGMFGTALSVIQSDRPEELTLLETLQANLPRKDDKVQPALLALDMKELEAFRYRVGDVRKRVTKKAVQETRIKELKLELLTNEKVKQHFENNPADLNFLELAKASNVHGMFEKKVSNSLATVPKYLLPGNNNNHTNITIDDKEFGKKRKAKFTGFGRKNRFSKKMKRKQTTNQGI